MTTSPFTPIVYVKGDCPFCLKLRLFLLEAGLLGKVQVRGTSIAEEDAIRKELRPVVEKVRFPTVQTAPGHYLSGSDDIIHYFAGVAGVDPDELPIFKAYVEGPLERIRSGMVSS